MRPDPVLAVAAAALSLALLSFVAYWRLKAFSQREVSRLRFDFERQARASSESDSELRRGLDALEETVRKTPEMPRSGALNRSTRAQALQLLRSGVSPDTAASSLGLCKREMQLLDRVARILVPR